MLINYVPGEECRIAINEDGRLEELYHERASVESHVGNIYKGRITNVEPAIQAAFVDFGSERNGFLHITDLHPKFFPGNSREQFERVGKKTPHRERPLIQNCLKRGQEILVQVLKEGIGTKGPTLTSYLSIPGRYLVMMPDMQRLGVSRKVEDDDARREVRKILDELETPEGFGFIVRTAGMGRNKTELKRDLAYLTRLWKTIDKRRTQVKVGELYVESDLIIRTLRDLFSTDIDRVIIDHPAAAKRASDFLSIINPRAGSKVFVYDEPMPLFHRFGIEKQIDTIHARTVPMPGGGSLVIDQTEALVAIDVNSGRMRDNKDAETTAFKTNQEAVDEICRQLRLRDMGGVVVCDFIDMRDPKKRRIIESRFRDNLKNDRAKTKVLPINQFGILALTRQRMRPSLNSALFNTCVHCDGDGVIKNPESVVLHVMRRLALVIHRPEVVRVELAISPDVAFQLLNKKRKHLVLLEQKYNATVLVRVHGKTKIDEVEIIAYDERGGIVNVDTMKQSIDDLELLPVTGDQLLADEIEEDQDEQIIHIEPEEEEHAGDSHLSVDLDDDELEPDTHGKPVNKPEDNANKEDSDQDQTDAQGNRKRRRRRGGRRRNKNRDRDQAEGAQSQEAGSEQPAEHGSPVIQAPREHQAPAKAQEPAQAAPEEATSADGSESQNESTTSGASRKRRRRRRGRGRDRDRDAQGAESSQPQEHSHSQDAKPESRPQQQREPQREPQREQQHDRAHDHKAPEPKRPEPKRIERSDYNNDKDVADQERADKQQSQEKQRENKPQVTAVTTEPKPKTPDAPQAQDEDTAKTTKKKTTRKKSIRKKSTKKVASKPDSGDNAPAKSTETSAQDKPVSRGYTNRRKRSTTKAPKDASDAPTATTPRQPQPAVTDGNH
jgi:ribonuclease E